jgi:hypothetical protein
MAMVGLLRPMLQDDNAQGGLMRLDTGCGAPKLHVSQLFTIFMFCLIAFLLSLSFRWPFAARIVPMVVGSLGLIFCGLSLLNEMCRKEGQAHAESMAQQAQHDAEAQMGGKIHMDIQSDTGHLDIKVIIQRAALFFGYMIGFMGSMATIGLIPTVPLFIIFFMRYEAREKWSLVVPYAMCMVVFIYFAFDQFMAIPWPQTIIGQIFPELRGVIPSI